MYPSRAFIILAPAVTTALAIGIPAFAQTTQLPSEPKTCEKNQVGFRLLAVKRLSPSVIAVEAEYENKSNIIYRLSHGDKQYTFIIDDSG
jgi:hypothetical protein